jgi:hypothetical protein
MTNLMKSALFLLVCLGAVTVHAAFPHLMNYQGRIDDVNGNPVADANYNVTFRLFNASANGSALWTETQPVTTVDGVFSVLLGSLDTIPEFIWYQDSAFLEIQPQGSDPVLPRSLIAVVPYSWRSRNSDLIGGLSAIDLEESSEIQSAISAHTAIPNAHHTKTIDASELIIGTLSEGRLPQGQIDSTELEQESIGSNRLANEPGIAHTYTQSVLLSSTMAVIDSVVITVPTGGWVLIQANGNFFRDHVVSGGNAAATVSLSASKISHTDYYSARFSVVSTQPTGTYTENFFVSQMLPVGPGTTKLYLIGDASYVGPGPRVERVHLNTVYFPTAYGNIDGFLH